MTINKRHKIRSKHVILRLKYQGNIILRNIMHFIMYFAIKSRSVSNGARKLVYESTVLAHVGDTQSSTHQSVTKKRVYVLSDHVRAARYNAINVRSCLGVYEEKVHLQEGEQAVQHRMHEDDIGQALGALHHRVHRHLQTVEDQGRQAEH